jgi:hypothetical protein
MIRLLFNQICFIMLTYLKIVAVAIFFFILLDIENEMVMMHLYENI